MMQRREIVLVFPVLMLTLFLVGCPKRPATTTAAAPAPSAPAPAVSTAPAPTPGMGTMPGAAGATRPVTPGAPGAATTPGAPARPLAPREFVATTDLKDIHFDFDKYDIRPDDAKILDENAKWMKTNPRYLVLIEGHCDERGTNEYNLALGERRAKTTMNYLVSQGVAANRMTLISYGEERPICREKTEECWTKNRRAHFLVKAQ